MKSGTMKVDSLEKSIREEVEAMRHDIAKNVTSVNELNNRMLKIEDTQNGIITEAVNAAIGVKLETINAELKFLKEQPPPLVAPSSAS
eukprot:2863715-Pyramimonas_sp.AAC.1